MYGNLKLKDYGDEQFVVARIEIDPVASVEARNSYAIWFLILLTFFILDGLFTYIGISSSGTEYEANLLVRHSMDAYGIGAGLLLSKSLAAISLLVLWKFRKDIIWILGAVRGLVVIYFVFAIAPWSYLLVNMLLNDYFL